MTPIQAMGMEDSAHRGRPRKAIAELCSLPNSEAGKLDGLRVVALIVPNAKQLVSLLRGRLRLSFAGHALQAYFA